MEIPVFCIFIFVYAGMILGGIPGLVLDRTGIALIGAIAVILTGAASPIEAWNAVDVSTIALLFGLMVVSSQFRLGGFYVAVTRALAASPYSPERILLLLVYISGLLSALLANDIVCLAMAPILIEGCAKKKLNPVPFLIALACASNIGSAATLIGNPQNMLIGQGLKLSFRGYLLDGAIPAALGLFGAWGIICWNYRGRWRCEFRLPEVVAPVFNLWQSGKGLVILALLLAVFLFTPWPREAAALAAAGILLTSRKMESRNMLGLVDWHVLVLFIGLFVVNHALNATGLAAAGILRLANSGADLHHPAWLFGATVVLSNLVSNVPAVMLLMPAATHPLAGPVLALSSTLAGNLIIVGSIANIIVVDKAAQCGIRIGWKEHARAGIPITILTLAIAAVWLGMRAVMH
ncbi:MAG: anion transporter [Candidatus Omnitrophota bacterium]